MPPPAAARPLRLGRNVVGAVVGRKTEPAERRPPTGDRPALPILRGSASSSSRPAEERVRGDVLLDPGTLRGSPIMSARIVSCRRPPAKPQKTGSVGAAGVWRGASAAHGRGEPAAVDVETCRTSRGGRAATGCVRWSSRSRHASEQELGATQVSIGPARPRRRVGVASSCPSGSVDSSSSARSQTALSASARRPDPLTPAWGPPTQQPDD